MQHGESYLGEGTVVPEVTLVGEAVADEAKLALLHILLDGVEKLLLGDLSSRQVSWRSFGIAIGVIRSLRKATFPSVREWRQQNSLDKKVMGGRYRLEHTSSLALVQRGISTIMLRMVCSWLA